MLPLSKVADAPTGLTVDVKVPQADDPDGLATAHVRKVVMIDRSTSVSSWYGPGSTSTAPMHA